MDKILLEIYLPAALTTFEVQVPAEATLAQITPLIAKSLAQLATGYYRAEQNPMLCEYHSGHILNVNVSLRVLGMKNGSKLMLV